MNPTEDARQFARILECHNALADALHSHASSALLSMYRKPSGSWGLWLTIEQPVPSPLNNAILDTSMEFDFTLHFIAVQGNAHVLEVLPLLADALTLQLLTL